MDYGTLEILQADGQLKRVTLTKPSITLGRGGDCDIVIADDQASRNHARVLCQPQGCTLIDLGSTNGTFLGTTRLAAEQPVPLAHQAVFRIGRIRIRYLAPTVQPAAQAPQPPAREAQPPAQPAKAPAGAPPQAPAAEPARTQAGPRLDGAWAKAPALPPGAPPPPRAAPPPPRVPPEPLHFLAKIAGRSRYLDYLPPIYSEDEFLGRFLLIFEHLWMPLERMVDNLHLYIDPHMAPADFLPWLAAWVDLALDPTWPEQRRRQLIESAVELYRWRGTRKGLADYLQLYTGGQVEIDDKRPQAHHFVVKLQLPKGANLDRRRIEAILDAEKPAHTTYELQVTGA